MKQKTSILKIGLFLYGGFSIFQMSAKENKQPNIVFILADDLGWADLPVYGNSFNEAPNIDKLANEGMLFTNAYAAAPVSSPTRASIISGQYPARVGIIEFIPGHWRPYEEVTVPVNRTQYLPEEIITVAEMLKDAGYSNGYFGKWHLGVKMEHHPLNQGFDLANIGGGNYYNSKFTPPREEGSEKRFSDRITDFGIDFIEENKDNPFFLFLSHVDVHVQLDADMDLINKYTQKEKVEGYPCNVIYSAMIEHIDHSVARIEQKLKETGLSENTIVIFFSDNGGLMSRYDRAPLLAKNKLEVYKDNPLRYIASSNAPLRGEKGTVYEGGIREPLIIKWSGKIPSSSVSKAIVSSVDFYPTLLEIADVDKATEQILDGTSFLPVLLKDQYDSERAIFWHYPVYHHDVPASAIRKGDWKLIENLVTNEMELYNLRLDISEAMDLADLYPKKTDELKRLLRIWQKEVGADFPISNPDFDDTKRLEWGIHPDRK